MMNGTKTSRQTLAALVGALLLAAAGCGPLARETPIERTTVPELDPRFGNVEVRPGSRAQILQRYFEPQAGEGACEVLNDIASGPSSSPGSRFRLVGSMKVASGADVIPKKSCFIQCLPIYWGSGACKRCRKERDEEVPIHAMLGRVDISASPIYQYALTTAEIPNRAEFIQLLEKAINCGVRSDSPDCVDYPIFLKPVVHLYAQFLKMSDAALYGTRNKLIAEQIQASLPGAFDTNPTQYSMKDSFPGVLLENGMPTFSTLSPLPSDGESVRRRKAKTLESIATAYSKTLPLFSAKGAWSAFESDTQRGLNAALDAFSHEDPLNQACATVLLHRNFSQLLTVAGHDRLPLAVDNPSQRVSALPPLENLLDDPHGKYMRVCPTAGAFGKGGYRRKLGQFELANFHGDRDTLTLMKRAPMQFTCSPDEAVSMASPEYKNYKRIKLSEEANGEELLNFGAGLAHYMIAFNIEAPWWTRSANVSGYPLAKMKGIADIADNGGILPLEAHALSLALIQITFDRILDRHLVFLDERGDETDDQDEAMGVRFSSAARKPLSGGVVKTNVKMATMALETVLKFSASLEYIAKWRREAPAKLKEALRRESDPRVRKKMVEAYNERVDGLFGGQKVLDMLSAVDDKSLRKQLSQAELAAALLGAAYARKTSGGEIGCYNELSKDLGKHGSTEQKLGTCSSEDARRWRKAMAQVAALYNSPLFAEFATGGR